MAHHYDWSNYLKLAKVILSEIENETGYRNAISRSYYAAYWQARIVLEMGGTSVPRTKSHLFVWESYRRVKVPSTGNDIEQLGNTLHSERLLADYDSRREITSYRAKTVVSDAEDLIGWITSLPDAGRAQAIQQAAVLAQSPSYRV